MRRMVDEPEHRAEIDASLKDVYETLFLTSSPTCTKAALNLLGHNVGGVRLPIVEATEAETEVVRAMLERHGLLAASEASPATAGSSSLAGILSATQPAPRA
jgi:4-hydroxy-tetrahydrodipicolinate synthase